MFFSFHFCVAGDETEGLLVLDKDTPAELQTHPLLVTS